MSGEMDLLFTVISREDKYKSKTFIDTVVYRAGDQIWLRQTGLQLLGDPSAIPMPKVNRDALAPFGPRTPSTCPGSTVNEACSSNVPRVTVPDTTSGRRTVAAVLTDCSPRAASDRAGR